MRSMGVFSHQLSDITILLCLKFRRQEHLQYCLHPDGSWGNVWHHRFGSRCSQSRQAFSSRLSLLPCLAPGGGSLHQQHLRHCFGVQGTIVFCGQDFHQLDALKNGRYNSSALFKIAEERRGNIALFQPHICIGLYYHVWK